MAADRPLEVTPEALATHAHNLDRVGETLRHGIAAAGEVRLGSEAYGRLCVALPAMLEPLHDLADRVLRESLTALEESADAVRAAGRRYRNTDDRAAHRFGSGR
ncbi:type VII secretion target [Micromonospora sp. DT47]|uniref:type VII secretion target n=1 Tax=Micromonospora sp. DT47 TaxID=3393431 RepID=UPI003CFAABA8